MGESPLLQFLLLLLFCSVKCVAPQYALIHRIFAWGAHQDREDRQAHHVSFGPRLHPSPPPFLLPFFPLTCFHRAGWSWMTIHACCCWIWMCVRERVWEPWHPIIWCLPNRPHTPVNSPGPLQSGFCAIPPSQSCHTSFQPDSTHIHTWSSASLQEISEISATSVPAESHRAAGFRRETSA